MYRRNITDKVFEALQDTPVVFLNGARQTGKSTLVQMLTQDKHPAKYLTFDDSNVLAAASTDPAGFIAGLEGALVIDEVQRVPDLFLAIKAEVDRNRKPGRFLLTGSANILLLPKLAESLVGRMEILTLWPLSQGEIKSCKEAFIDRLFSKKTISVESTSLATSTLVKKILSGGFPEVLSRTNANRQKAWFGSYVTTILQRDVRDISNIEGLTSIPRLLSLVASRTCGLLNYAELSRSFSIPQSTLKRYLSLLETTFLIKLLPAWSGNLGKRLVKSPKILLTDTGLIAHLIGVDQQRLKEEPQLLGALLENFAAMELVKQIGWSKVQPQLFHFRTQTGQEVDFLLEDSAGRIVGIEVKASSTVRTDDLKGLRMLADSVGDKFMRGIVLYCGSDYVPFGSKLAALPMSELWSGD
jgi:predicted AAA+ superfamily ATPase